MPGMPGTATTWPGSARPRICSSWARAAICWANSAVWMPWNSPSSQPTSCAWAIRSSASLGIWSSSKGSVSRSSSSRSSGASPSSSSLIEDWWISRSRTRPASSSGAARTSSSSCLIMVPIRITLAGCSTCDIRSGWPSESSPPAGDCSTTTCSPSGPPPWPGWLSLRGVGSRSVVSHEPVLSVKVPARSAGFRIPILERVPGQPVASTSLPTWSLAATIRCASPASARPSTRCTTGRTRPDSTSGQT